MDNLYYKWEVKFMLSQHNLIKSSQTLLYPDDILTKFKLIWLFGCRFTDNNHLCAYLVINETDLKKEIWANFNFSIIDKKGKKFKSFETKQACKFFKSKYWGFQEFISKDIMLDATNELINTNRQFTMVCEITASSWEFDFAPGLSTKIECNFLDNLWSMYENKKLCDVTISVQDQEFKAHKNILAARSPVFSAMFEHEMEESKQNQVKITDMDPNVFQEIMCFVYTGKSPNVDFMAEDLLAAADKYQMKRLKIMCGETLSKKLSIDNAATILFLADLYSITLLKMLAIDFICEHANEIEQTEDFKSIMTSHPHLLIENFHALASKTMSSYEKQNPVLIDRMSILLG